MALQKTITFKGITVSDAYIRIQSFNGNKNLLKFDVATHSQAGEQVLTVLSFEISYDINGTNPIKQAYAHLKTLPEFAGATDC
jgi:hypothetical protein